MATTEYEEWLKRRSPRRIQIEKLAEKFHDAKRELWQMCPCPKCCSQEHKSRAMQNRLLILPGKFFDGEKVEICTQCEGRGFLIDWEREL